MLTVVNPQDQIIAARVVELLSSTAPWNRALWGVNTVLTLKEVLEAADAARAGILGEDSQKRLGSIALRLVGKDRGVLDAEKPVLTEALRTSPRYGGLNYHTVSQLAQDIESQYLQRWSVALASTTPPSSERAARSIAGFLLDQRFSAEFLKAWFVRLLYQDENRVTLPALIEAAQSELYNRALIDFDVLIAFSNAPRSASGFPANWLRAHQLSEWLTANNIDVSGMRAGGGLELKIRARDSHAAAQVASQRIDHFIARAAVATTVPLEPWPQIWVRGESAAFQYGMQTRGVRVKALYRESQIFNEPTSNVDAAIELLSHLETSSPPAAIAGGWAAVEALLAEPNDRAGAADSLAAIVACSFPRAELTALSYTVENTCPELKTALEVCSENRDRALVVAGAIQRGTNLNLRKHSDRAAHHRMERLLRDPSRVLSDIQQHVGDAFNRLYRQRNLILHGGRTHSIALEGSLRTASKLVGAGMDRIAHAWYVRGIDPIQLAARSKAAIQLIPASAPLTCVDLLGM